MKKNVKSTVRNFNMKSKMCCSKAEGPKSGKLSKLRRVALYPLWFRIMISILIFAKIRTTDELRGPFPSLKHNLAALVFRPFRNLRNAKNTRARPKCITYPNYYFNSAGHDNFNHGESPRPQFQPISFPY